jgi:hypothetical protein
MWMVRSDGKRRWGVSGVSSLIAHLALVVAAFAGGRSHADSPRTAGFFAPGVVETTVVIELVTPNELASAPAPEPAPPEPVKIRRAAVRRVPAPRSRPAEVPVVTETVSPWRSVEPAFHGNPDEGAPDADDQGPRQARASATGPGGSGISVSAQARPLQQTPPIASLKWGYRRIYQTFPRVPDSLSVRGKIYIIELQLCVAADGQVSHVGLRRGAAPELDEVVVANALTWRYHPYMVDGAPRPFCHMMKIDYEVE